MMRYGSVAAMVQWLDREEIAAAEEQRRVRRERKLAKLAAAKEGGAA